MTILPTPVTALVPALNEEKTIGGVVKILRDSPLIRDVIVISDGSTDRTAAVAKAAGACVIIHAQRRGKGEAIFTGLHATDAPVVLLADADLLGLTPAHINALLAPVLSGVRVMNVGLRDRGFFLNRLLFHLPLLGGERALRREILERIPRAWIGRFRLETGLNAFCRRTGEPYGAVALPGLTMRKKMEKVGRLHGLWEYLRMAWDVIVATVRFRFLGV